VAGLLPEEIRFAITILLTGLIFVCGFRLSRSLTRRDWIANSLDALLFTFLVEYLAV